MNKEIIGDVNQDLMNRIKEIYDVLGSLEVELSVANRAIVNMLNILSDHLLMDYVNEDIVDFSRKLLKNTYAMKSFLTFMEEVAHDLLKTVSSSATSGLAELS